jgi:peptidoglycan/xylan/chitin deacetylase (PgdA/CDA1 family)
MLKIATLGYHDVTDDSTSSGFQRPMALAYKHTCPAFDAHLDAIAAGPVSPTLVTDVDFTQPHGRHLLLTFDDGGQSALYVSDILCRRGWRAHFMITTSLIGSRTFVDKSAILQLRKCGHIVGSHSHTHPDIFRELSPDEMRREWAISCDILSQLLGEPCVSASVPGGDISASALESASSSHIRYLFTSEPRLTPQALNGCHILGRVSVKGHTSVSRVRQYATFQGWSGALLKRRCSLVARRLCHPLYTLYVRRQTIAFSSVRQDDPRSPS